GGPRSVEPDRPVARDRGGIETWDLPARGISDDSGRDDLIDAGRDLMNVKRFLSLRPQHIDEPICVEGERPHPLAGGRDETAGRWIDERRDPELSGYGSARSLQQARPRNLIRSESQRADRPSRAASAPAGGRGASPQKIYSLPPPAG